LKRLRLGRGAEGAKQSKRLVEGAAGGGAVEAHQGGLAFGEAALEAVDVGGVAGVAGLFGEAAGVVEAALGERLAGALEGLASACFRALARRSRRLSWWRSVSISGMEGTHVRGSLQMAMPLREQVSRISSARSWTKRSKERRK
jgi:hypothetical protein